MFFNAKTTNLISRLWAKRIRKIRLKQIKKQVKKEILWAAKERGWFEMTVYVPIREFPYIKSYLLKKGYSIETTARELTEDYEKAIIVRWGENKDGKNLHF